jgi:hypothetical protein
LVVAPHENVRSGAVNARGDVAYKAALKGPIVLVRDGQSIQLPALGSYEDEEVPVLIDDAKVLVGNSGEVPERWQC